MLFYTVAVEVPPEPRPPKRRALDSLRRRWLLTFLIYAACLLGGYQFLANVWRPAQALWWLGWAGLAMVVELVVLWRVLPHNHPPDSPILLPTFGYGTILTLLCGLLLFLLAGFLFAPPLAGLLAWLPALLYSVARIVDYVDGYVARITHHETKLGGILDMEFDGLGVLITVLIGIQYGKLPLWYLPLALSRQLFLLGIWLRKRLGKPVYEMTPSANRRITAGFQTGFISVMLWPIFTPPLSTLAATLFALPLIASFLRDWLVVSGVLDPTSPRYIQGRARIKNVIEGWLPLACRLLGTVIALLILWQEIPDFSGWQTYWEGSDAGAPSELFWGISILAIVALPFFLLGIVGRLAGLVLIALACMDIITTGLHWSDNAWLFVVASIVAHAGSGHLALWRPEDSILHRRPGAQGPVY